MSVREYEESGAKLWMVYVNVRHPKILGARKQKTVKGFKSESAALQEEKRLLKSLTAELNEEADNGPTWEEVLEKWELAMRKEGNHFPYSQTTIQDYVSCLRRWTSDWLPRHSNTLGRADGRSMLSQLEAADKSRNFRKNVKYMVNVVFKWAIEERVISGVAASPVEGVKLSADKFEKVPDIFTIDEMRTLLKEAKSFEHPWYPVWATAMLTGMRNGELHALLWSDVDLEGRRITVSKSYDTRMRRVKSTKAGYWRTVPIADELYALLSELKAQAGDRAHVLPRFWEWDKGEQARVLRKFCLGIGIRSVCFHALRACFATQLLANDIAPARVMKICGWRDLKTMQHYVRLAGVDERGATDVLRVLPSDSAVMAEVVNLFDFKGRNQ
jgi:integrase